MLDVEVEEAAGGFASCDHSCGEGAAFDFGGAQGIFLAAGGDGEGFGAEVGGRGAGGG